ncbi:MAG: hypothetical protein HRF40_11655, partial [Nitrososphaera sp.]
MPATLATILKGLDELQKEDAANGSLIQEFYLWMKDNQSSEAHQKNNPKAIMN